MQINEYEEFLNKPDPYHCPSCNSDVDYVWDYEGDMITGINGYWKKVPCPRHYQDTHIKILWSVVLMVSGLLGLMLIWTLIHT